MVAGGALAAGQAHHTQPAPAGMTVETRLAPLRASDFTIIKQIGAGSFGKASGFAIGLLSGALGLRLHKTWRSCCLFAAQQNGPHPHAWQSHQNTAPLRQMDAGLL